MTDLLTESPSECLAPVIELLSKLGELGITPASLRVEWRCTSQTEPYLHCWVRNRTDFEALTKELKLKTERTSGVNHRTYSTKGESGPLIQCASFPHQDDWEATA